MDFFDIVFHVLQGLDTTLMRM